MLPDTEGGRDVAKIEGRKLWIEELKAEESGVVGYRTPNLQVCSSIPSTDEPCRFRSFRIR